jgi:hypothetical protein
MRLGWCASALQTQLSQLFLNSFYAFPPASESHLNDGSDILFVAAAARRTGSPLSACGHGVIDVACSGSPSKRRRSGISWWMKQVRPTRSLCSVEILFILLLWFCGVSPSKE